MSGTIKVLLVEDDLDFVYLIKKMITDDSRLEFLGHAGSRQEAVPMAKAIQPDIVLMDLNLSKNELDGIDAAKEIGLCTKARIILLTSFEQPEVIISASKKAFACAYVFKSHYQQLPDIIARAAASHTPQEQMINELILQDLSPAERSIVEIMTGKGSTLHSASKTINNQKTNIFKKLGIKNSNELIHLFCKYYE